MTFKTLDDMDLDGKIVLTRVDINVPVENGRVTDTTRIDRIVPTIKDIVARGGKPVMLAHFGRPKGQVVPEMSLRQVVPALSEALGSEVAFVERPDRGTLEGTTGPILIENTRFSPMEEANDPQMAQFLASLGDVYCNDAFSAAHRAHASTEGVARLLPACAGRLMQAELEALEAALGTPKPPVAAVVGGAKVSSKLDLLGNLVTKVQHLIIGGGMANTFLAAQGVNVQASLCEHDLLDTARDILAKAEAAGCAILLPRDVVVAAEFKANPPTRTVKTEEVPEGQMILDAGPDSVAHIKTVLDGCATLIWNGPLGAFEMSPFDAATNAAAAHAAVLTKAGTLVSVAGGGDTVAALNQAGAAEAFSYISTAGGAFLEWMEGKELPGVAALSA
ncbi:phosphoglycerate kinase [Jannaschia pagri]|uniref:Phosphoglycerate kinase n=1 Tax=Jannaschia pagri TaxID=2829797 RepID=A0ABQ4NMM7_9RHOB|nr:MULTISPECIES: phosphoglycerate kinase [unclassified Jannaschia]GIT91834.1 phosphoglycerate kinase [Jannaschia sp. AI_61]GIT95668.1 phosphoglycerate kinase [Jannaschia sp. AI_62]